MRGSYDDPKLTFDTNLGGTVNVLECLRTHSFIEAAVIITSDKCYQNVEWEWGYRENDALGGDDPYSASKACAEMAGRAYIQSYFKAKNSPKIATTRAGNVIGGGDWARDRIIPDCVRAWSKIEKTVIRNPQAKRPWQHVLEPLSGYLWLGARLINAPENVAGEAFNFGPDSKVNQSVTELTDLFLAFLGEGAWKRDLDQSEKKECGFLKLNCDKALNRLGWHSVFGFEKSVRFTAEWYKHYYHKKDCMDAFSDAQIEAYVKKAREYRIAWIGNTAQ